MVLHLHPVLRRFRFFSHLGGGFQVSKGFFELLIPKKLGKDEAILTTGPRQESG